SATFWSILAALCCAPKWTRPTFRTVRPCRCCWNEVLADLMGVFRAAPHPHRRQVRDPRRGRRADAPAGPGAPHGRGNAPGRRAGPLELPEVGAIGPDAGRGDVPPVGV